MVPSIGHSMRWLCAGHILDDQDLVETLQQSKGKNQEIYTRVQQSEVTEKSINSARKKYLPVRVFFFVILVQISEMMTFNEFYIFL